MQGPESPDEFEQYFQGEFEFFPSVLRTFQEFNLRPVLEHTSTFYKESRLYICMES